MKTFTAIITCLYDIEQAVEANSIDDSAQLLIQLFSGTNDAVAIIEFQTFFQLNFPLATLIGSTSDGVICNADVDAQGGSLLSFTFFQATTLSVALINQDDTLQDDFQLGKKIALTLITHNTKLLITFTDGTNTNGEEYLNGITFINKDIIIAGGMAGDNGLFQKTFVFDKYNLVSSGAVAVALHSEVLQVVTNYNFAWLPIGKKLRISKSIRNRVYEIDGMSAVDLYAKYLGEEIAQQLPSIGIEFPLIFERNGTLIGRAVLYKHDDDSLTFAGNIHEGELVRFGVGNIEAILQNSYNHICELLDKSQFQPETFFIYSCMARRRFMGSYTQKELRSFAQMAPTAGFFTYGEFYHAQGENQLLNETMTSIALSESSVKTHTLVDNQMIVNDHFRINPLHVLSHLTNVVSGELEDLNNTLESRIKANRELIWKQAYLEKLTQLPNRLQLLEALPNHHNKILFLLNIDDFALINDFYGHAAGDFVLKHIAILLQEYANTEGALLFKLPSDEYALILQKAYNNEELKDTIKHILTLVQKSPALYDDNIINIELTLSAAMINTQRTGLINANLALKLAKQSSKSFLIFDESLLLAQHCEINLKMATVLRHAIKQDAIIPYVQPIFNTTTGVIEKYESLVRLRQEDGKILPPIAFLDIAHKIKLYPQITKIMVEKSFSFFKKNGLNFSLNLSFADILNQETREFIFEKIQEFDIAQQLTFEILETQQIEDELLVQKFIQKAHNQGADFAIDDFGSGFANFIHMTKMKADCIKIDGSLIKNMDTDKNARLVVETIVVFAQKLNMKTVAEFVHSKEIFDIVKELQIDYAQGYYLGKPIPLEEISHLV